MDVSAGCVCVLGDGQQARVSVVMGTRGACAVGGEECVHVSARMSFARTSQEFTIAQSPTPTCLQTTSDITRPVKRGIVPFHYTCWVIPYSQEVLNNYKYANHVCTYENLIPPPHMTRSLNRVTISNKGWYARHNTCVSSCSFPAAAMGSIFHVIWPRPIFLETQSFEQCMPGFPVLSVQQLKSTNW